MTKKRLTKLVIFFIFTYFTLVWALLAVPRNMIAVSDQAVGEAIYFKTVTLKESGHLVFSQDGEIHSATDYLPAGIYADKNFEPFFRIKSGPFRPGKLTVTLYVDNGDTIFNPELDHPAKNIWGRTYQKTITLLVDNGLQSDIEGLIKSCQTESRGIDYGCFKDKLRPLVNQSSLAGLADSLDTLFKLSQTREGYGVTSCHGPAHILGEIAIETGLDWQDVANSCDRACDYGCIHGAFNRKFVSDPNFTGEFGTICSQVVTDDDSGYQSDSCYHLVGHALGETYNQLPQALAACREMETPYYQGHCTEGALMDYFFGVPAGRPALFSGDLEDTISLCDNLHPTQKGSCWQNIGLYALSLYGNKPAVLAACQNVPDLWRGGCFRSLGERAYFYFTNSWKDAINFCDQVGSYALDCLYGVIESDIADSREHDFSLNICDNIAPSSQVDCRNYVKEMATYIWGE